MTASIYPQNQWKLDPVAVRRRAKGLPGVKALPSNSSDTGGTGGGEHIVSFLAGLNDDTTSNNASASASGLARLNIFVDTGTIATTRVLQGIPRESYRRNVTSLDVVERLLRHPPVPTIIDDTLVGTSDTTTTILANPASQSSHQKPTKSLKEDMELAHVGVCILNGEIEKLENHVLSLEDEQLKNPNSNQYQHQQFEDASETAEEKDKDTTTNNNNDDDDDDDDDDGEEGMEFQFSLPASAMKHVEQCLQDISRMNKLVRGVATNGKGTIFLYGNGGVAYTPNIPKHLYQKLKVLRNSPISARPSYVSLGTRDRYFVAFKDQAVDWKGPKALDKILKNVSNNNGPAPQSVAFGSSYDTFFVVFGDGTWKSHGKSIPRGLLEKLEERANSATNKNDNDLVCVNLGPHGEWFLRATNGRMWWGGISEDLDAVTQDILRGGNVLHFIDFGEDGSYFLSHDS